MNRKLIILFVVIGSYVSSCNKFEHESFALPNCELCDYAETLEGTYRGMSGGVAVPNYGDSVTITVDQLFLGNSQYDDSTFVRLQVDYDFDSSTEVKSHIIRLKNSEGDCKAYMEGVFGPIGSNVISHPQGYYSFTSDSLKISYSNSSGSTMVVQYFGGDFAKQ